MAQPPSRRVVGDRFSSAPPGYSLTLDNQQWPWGQPAKFADPEQALESSIEKLMKPRNNQDGLFTPDVGMLMKPALALVIADMAEEEGIPYRMFENDGIETQGEMDDETFLRMMKANNPRLYATIKEDLNAALRAGMAPREPEPERGFLSAKQGEE